MQYTTIFLAAAATATASVLPREANVFDITNFSISGSPGSVYTNHVFDAAVTLADGSDSAHCQESGSSVPASPFAPNTTCGNPEWSFSFEEVTLNGQEGYNLVVDFLQTGVADVWRGCKFYPDSQIKYVDDDTRGPGAQYVVVESEKDFSIVYNTNGEC